jgi:hypothetical protein
MSNKDQRDSNRLTARKLGLIANPLQNKCLNCGLAESHYVSPFWGIEGFYSCNPKPNTGWQTHDL